MIQNLKTELGTQTEKTQEMFNKELDDLKWVNGGEQDNN